MNTKHDCPVCGKTLAPDAPGGLCPVCLLKAAASAGDESADTPPAPGRRRTFSAPRPAELAAHFPQLEILALIGQGGMGAVYQARQPRLDRLVALKILAPEISRAPAFAERFTREARALARLTHPNIVAVHDFGQAGEYHYLVMEFVDGATLRQLLNRGPIAPKEALAIVPSLCAALQFAHDRGIVHRDIKPENILIARSGTVKIADFGLAKLVGDSAPDAALTGPGDVMGTPHYMAPEQIERPLSVDHRADIYAVGVVFYQLLTGELPLGRFAPPSRKVQVDVRLDEIVLRALEKEPELRYQQASQLKADVETVASTRAGTAAAPPGIGEQVRQAIARAVGVSPLAAPAPARPDGTNARADGAQIVVPVSEPRLPQRCVVTNEPVSLADVRKTTLEWIPPLLWLSWLATPVAFIVLYFLFRRRLPLEIPLSPTGRTVVRGRSIIAGCLLVAGIVGIIAGLGAKLFAVFLLGCAVLLSGVIYGLLKAPTLKIVKLENGEAWLAGASPVFLATLPAFRK